MRNRLTPRDLEIVALIVRGLTNTQIGCKLGVSHHAVEAHITRILQRLGYQTRTEIAVWAAVNQIVPIDQYLMKG